MVPPPPIPRRPDHDHRPSMRMLVAASMLRHGHDPHAVAEATGVPLALVDLIGEQLDTHPATSPPPPAPHPSPDHRAGKNIDADPHPPATPTSPVGVPRAPERHAHRWARITGAVLLCWVINLGVAATAGLLDLPALGIACLILTPVLVIVLVLHAPTRPPPTGRTPPGASPW